MADIEAKVAALVSSSQVAFNRGFDNGVQVGDTIVIRRTVTVKDPDTGEVIGSVWVPKLNLEVEHVQEKMCVGTVTDSVENQNIALGIGTLWAAKKTVTLDSMGTTGTSSVVRLQIGEAATIKTRPQKDQDEGEDSGN